MSITSARGVQRSTPRTHPHLAAVDQDSGVEYVPFMTNDGIVGYRCERDTERGVEVEYIYLNPSLGSDDGVASVFVYIDAELRDGELPFVGACQHYTIFEGGES